jgi:asparagine synthase (glutamine-hydrolysing)
LIGLAGLSSFSINFTSDIKENTKMLESMVNCDSTETSIFSNENVALYSQKLNTETMSPFVSDCGNYTVIFTGELFNASELKKTLQDDGYEFKTNLDCEVVLSLYIKHDSASSKLLNGNFAYVIWDNVKKQLFMCRDKFGVKPLYYSIAKNCMVFSSNLGCILKYPDISPILDKNGLHELLGLFPSRSEGGGVFKDINELKFGSYAIFDSTGFREEKYWQLESKENTMTYDELVAQTRLLVTDSVKRQMIHDTPICTFLSGGIDSSIITAIIANEYKKEGKTLDTYSFDYEDNSEFFVSNSFQVDTDKKWVIKMVEEFKTNHTFLECDINSLVSNLYDAVDAKDFPGMADIDSSLLFFCDKVSENHKLAISGECADEIFAGYPWFHDENVLKNDVFPWIRDTELRRMLISEEILNKLDIDEYVCKKYNDSIFSVPHLEGENDLERRRREISYLTLKWFMPTLVERTDRMSLSKGLDVRIPFADYRIVELLWNTPWEMKCNGIPKSLLRDAFKDLLPEELINRKKCPFPKTYNPLYENMLKDELRKVIKDSSSPILKIINKEKVLEFLNVESDYGKPWFGQLMAGPQLIAFYLQINYWLKKYNVIIEI